jgi:transcriptional regulator with XRE-family HTH domain
VPTARPISRQQSVDQAFGCVLRDLRVQRGLSQDALALAAGSGRTFVRQLERGERGASLKTLFRLAAELGVAPAEIVTRIEREIFRLARPRLSWTPNREEPTWHS